MDIISDRPDITPETRPPVGAPAGPAPPPQAYWGPPPQASGGGGYPQPQAGAPPQNPQYK
ncbi:hypothetical protein APSETT445_002728 [Aspergillus pseudonomiae]